MSDTLTQVDTTRNGNTESIPRCRKWCFTLYNYSALDIDTLTQTFSKEKYIFQEETGISGKPHLQGYVEFKNARYLSSLKKINKEIHWEETRNEKASIQYCQKEETRSGNIFTNIIPQFKTLNYEQLYDWQKQVIEIIKTEPNDRTIYWFWEPNGCAGKTCLIKYIIKHFPKSTFSCATKSSDILTIADAEKNIYLINFVRTQQDYAPWSALEQLKDGLISDSKLKKISRNIIMDSPHVICFANWPPNVNTMSKDRWNIIEIKNHQHSSVQNIQHNNIT